MPCHLAVRDGKGSLLTGTAAYLLLTTDLRSRGLTASPFDAVRVAVDNIDDLDPVDQLPDRGQVSVHLIRDLHPQIGTHHAGTVLPWIR
jgi:hypothetical protein